jgi:hypothetical protein
MTLVGMVMMVVSLMVVMLMSLIVVHVMLLPFCMLVMAAGVGDEV